MKPFTFIGFFRGTQCPSHSCMLLNIFIVVDKRLFFDISDIKHYYILPALHWKLVFSNWTKTEGLQRKAISELHLAFSNYIHQRRNSHLSLALRIFHTLSETRTHNLQPNVQSCLTNGHTTVNIAHRAFVHLAQPVGLRESHTAEKHFARKLAEVPEWIWCVLFLFLMARFNHSVRPFLESVHGGRKYL